MVKQINLRYKKGVQILYRLIKLPLFQKFLLISILLVSILLSIALLILVIRNTPFNWFYLPVVSGFITIPLFLIPICIFFLKNMDLFDYTCEKIFKILIKPWLIPILIVIFSLGFYFIYSALNLPILFYPLVLLPILPFYLIRMLLEIIPTPTKYSSTLWSVIFSFFIIIPLLIYFFNLIGKKILLNTKIPKTLNSEKFEYNQLYKFTKRQSLFKEIILCWLLAFFMCFLLLFGKPFGYDTPYYYIFVKDYFESGNLDLIFNPQSKSTPYSELTFSNTYKVLPIVILLIIFSIICGGDIILGSIIMISLMFSIGPPLLILITNNITHNTQIAIYAGIFYFFSSPILMLVSGVLNQLLSVDILLISLFLFTTESRQSWKKKLFKIIAFLLILSMVIFYIFFMGIFYLVITQYFLQRNKLNFKFLKNPRTYKFLKFILLYSVFGLLFFFYLFGFVFNFIASIFSFPFNTFFYLYAPDFFTPQSNNNIINSTLNISLLGVSILFIIMGLVIEYKTHIIHNLKIREFLTIFLECTSIFLFLDVFGFKFLAIRWLPYVAIPGSIFSGIGFIKMKELFPKITNKSPKSPKLMKLMKVSLICVFITSYPLQFSHYRNAYVLQEEIDAMEWFKTRSDYDKLINSNISDVLIITNRHLNNWIEYKIHYNAISDYYGFTSLSSLKIEDDLEKRVSRFKKLRNEAHEKLYIFISSYKEYFGEEWTYEDLIEFFNEYHNYYAFNWNNYTINEVVEIWEIEYIFN